MRRNCNENAGLFRSRPAKMAPDPFSRHPTLDHRPRFEARERGARFARTLQIGLVGISRAGEPSRGLADAPGRCRIANRPDDAAGKTARSRFCENLYFV